MIIALDYLLQAVINCQTVLEDGEECFTSTNRRTLMMQLR